MSAIVRQGDSLTVFPDFPDGRNGDHLLIKGDWGKIGCLLLVLGQCLTRTINRTAPRDEHRLIDFPTLGSGAK
jgi:hypothetical protein